MNEITFDSLARVIGRGRGKEILAAISRCMVAAPAAGASQSRRRFLSHVMSLALSTPLALFDAAEAGQKGDKSQRRRKRGRHHHRKQPNRHAPDARANKKGKKKKDCAPCKKRKQGKCKADLPDGSTCPGGSCRAGECVPSTPGCTPNCGNNICGDNGCGGSCGSCDANHFCENGTCALTCSSGLTPCAGTCVDLQSDLHHCGTCGTACSFPNAGARCDRGVCTMGACDEGFADCDGNPATGCEYVSDWGGDCTCEEAACKTVGGCCHGSTCTPTNFDADTSNCGACGHVCQFAHATARCEGGTCAIESCDAGWDNCDGQTSNGCEINIHDDDSHCGACGNACAGVTPACSGDGVCVCGDVCASGCRFSTVQAAIDAARPGGTVRLCGETWALAETVLIDKNLTLKGVGAESTVLHGGDAVRVLRIANDAIVTLQDLTIAHGQTLPYSGGPYDGAGIRNQGTLTLIRCNVTHNRVTAGYSGGGISNDRGAVELRGSNVTDNISSSGGGIYNTFGTVTLKAGSHVTRNGARDGAGIATSGTLTLEADTSVTDNTGGLFGGGIATWGTVTLKSGSRVAGNSAQYGGGINIINGTVTMEDGSSVEGNSGAYGGGIYKGSSLVLETGSRVADNSATGDGGGIYISGGPLTMKNGSRVEGNTAEGKGGGIYAQYGTLGLQAGSHVTTNVAHNGGGLFNDPDYPATVTLEDDDIITTNYLTDETTVSNCSPIDTIPNCIG